MQFMQTINSLLQRRDNIHVQHHTGLIVIYTLSDQETLSRDLDTTASCHQNPAIS